MSAEIIPVEIHDTPAAIRDTLVQSRVWAQAAAQAMRAREPRRIYLIGNGTSYYSCLAAAYTARLLAEFSEREQPPVWLKTTVTARRMAKLEQLGLVPDGLDSGVAEVMHRTTNGVDADAVNILLGGIKCAIGDYKGMYLATDLSDILFGTPAPVLALANLGCLREVAVNVAVHGHNPVLSEIIVAEAQALRDEAVAGSFTKAVHRGAPKWLQLPIPAKRRRASFRTV